MLADPLRYLSRRQLAIRLHDGPLGMGPAGLDVVEPGARHRQLTDLQRDAAGSLDLPIMFFDPARNEPGRVPRGIVPDHDQPRLALLTHTPAGPIQELDGDLSQWPPLDEAKHDPARVVAKESVAADGIGIGVVVVRPEQSDPPRRTIRPGVKRGLGDPTPPDLVLESEHPIRVLRRQPDQAVPPFLLGHVIRVGAGHPGFRPPPVDADSHESASDGLAAQPPLGYPPLIADLRE